MYKDRLIYISIQTNTNLIIDDEFLLGPEHFFYFRLRSESCSSENNKKVSRAESWRYESSIYIKPPGNQVQVIKNFVRTGNR